MQSERDSGHIWIKFEIFFFRQIFEKTQISNFTEKSVQWEGSCSMRKGRRTDRHDEATSRFSQFYERA